MPAYEKKTVKKDVPSEFDSSTVNTIRRIEKNANVVGVMHIHKGNVQLCTIPKSMTLILTKKLPALTSTIHYSIGEIITNMKIVSNLLKDSHDEWLVRTTASLNEINPVVDRIMEDDSVEGVIMTNKEGIPILTNVNLMGATSYGLAMKRLGEMTQMSTKEIDIFDDVLILRLITKKFEIMVAPNLEFNIIVMQHTRDSSKPTKPDNKKLKK